MPNPSSPRVLPYTTRVSNLGSAFLASDAHCQTEQALTKGKLVQTLAERKTPAIIWRASFSVNWAISRKQILC